MAPLSEVSCSISLSPCLPPRASSRVRVAWRMPLDEVVARDVVALCVRALLRAYHFLYVLFFRFPHSQQRWHLCRQYPLQNHHRRCRHRVRLLVFVLLRVCAPPQRNRRQRTRRGASHRTGTGLYCVRGCRRGILLFLVATASAGCSVGSVGIPVVRAVALGILIPAASVGVGCALSIGKFEIWKFFRGGLFFVQPTPTAVGRIEINKQIWKDEEKIQTAFALEYLAVKRLCWWR